MTFGPWRQLSRGALSRHLDGRPMLRAAIMNSGWLLTDRAVRMLLAVLVGAWVARHLGPERYGELAYVIAAVALWQSVASLGLESIVVRDLAMHPGSASAILGTACGLRIGAAVLCWVGAVASVFLLVPDNRIALVVAAVLATGLVFQAADLVDQWYQARTLSRSTVASRSAAYLLAALVKVAMILLDAPLWGFGVALLCDVAFVATALAWTYRRDPARVVWQFDRTRAAGLLRDAWPLLVAGVSITVYMRIDQMLLKALAGEAQLGLYSAIVPISQVLHVIPMTVSASVLPRLSVLKTADPAQYLRRMQQFISIMAWAGIGTAGLIALLAPYVVGLLLGAAYDAAVQVLRWHALTNVFVFLGVAQSVAIIGDGRPRMALYRTLLGAVVSATANVLLVPRWGAVGAAWAACAAYFAAAVLSNAVLAPQYLKMQARSFWPFYAP